PSSNARTPCLCVIASLILPEILEPLRRPIYHRLTIDQKTIECDILFICIGQVERAVPEKQRPPDGEAASSAARGASLAHFHFEEDRPHHSGREKDLNCCLVPANEALLGRVIDVRDGHHFLIAMRPSVSSRKAR